MPKLSLNTAIRKIRGSVTFTPDEADTLAKEIAEAYGLKLLTDRGVWDLPSDITDTLRAVITQDVGWEEYPSDEEKSRLDAEIRAALPEAQHGALLDLDLANGEDLAMQDHVSFLIGVQVGVLRAKGRL